MVCYFCYDMTNKKFFLPQQFITFFLSKKCVCKWRLIILRGCEISYSWSRFVVSKKCWRTYWEVARFFSWKPNLGICYAWRNNAVGKGWGIYGGSGGGGGGGIVEESAGKTGESRANGTKRAWEPLKSIQNEEKNPDRIFKMTALLKACLSTNIKEAQWKKVHSGHKFVMA
jgi:hypothetical protein